MAIPTQVQDESGSGAGSLSSLLPVGWQDGDIVYVWIGCLTTDSLPTTTGASPPNIAASDSGWTQEAGSPQGVTGGTKLYMFWRRMRTGDTSPQTGDSGAYQVFNAVAIRGALASGTPHEATAFGSETTSDTSLSIPSIRTLGADRYILGACTTGADKTTSQFDLWTNSNLANIGEIKDECTNVGDGGGVASYAGEKATQGDTGATTATLATASPKAYVHFAVIPASSAQQVNVKQSTETSASQSSGKIKRKSLTQRTETQLAQATGKVKTKAVAEVLAGVDRALAIAFLRTYTVKIASEAGTAQVAGKLKVKVVAQPSATEVALTIGPSRAFPVGQVTEADAPGNIAAGELRPVGDAQETSLALRISAERSYSLGQASSASSALRAAPVRTRRIDVVQAVEPNSAELIGKARAYAPTQTGERDVAMNVAATHAVPVEQVEQASMAQSITPMKTYAVGLPIDTSSAQILTSSKALGISSTVSVDRALVSAALKAYQLKQVFEQDSAQIISGKGEQLISVAQVFETDTSFRVTAPIKATIGQVTEADKTGSVAPLKSKVLGQVAETSLPQSVSSIHLKTLAQINDSNFAQSVGKLRSVTLSETLSNEGAGAFESLKEILLGFVTETDFALEVSDKAPPILVLVGESASLEIALAVLRKARMGSGVVSTEEVGQVFRISEPVGSGSASESSGRGLTGDERVGSSRTSTEPVGGTE